MNGGKQSGVTAGLWPAAIAILGATLTDSDAAGLAAGVGIGLLTIVDLILIVRLVQRSPTTVRTISSAVGMVAGLAVLWGGGSWVAGNVLFAKIPDPGGFSTHYWLSLVTVASLGLIWTVVQLLLWSAG